MTEEEYFRKNYPNSCYGDKPLSPHWDFFQDGVEFGERQSEKRIEELLALLKAERKRQEQCDDIHLRKIADLEQENAELKEKLKPENCLKLLAKEGYVKFTSEQLIKAKELLLELYDCIPSSMADSCKETLQNVALFFKDSEVEK